MCETMRCSVLLHQFKESRQRMAVVVDEYGGTEGIVTMEDLLESIVGEMDDEHDDEEENGIVQLSPTSWMLDGELEVEEVERVLGNDFLTTMIPTRSTGLSRTCLGASRHRVKSSR